MYGMYVILNADYFGKSLEQNEVIDEAYKCGFVRSIGLIVTEEYLQDAIVIARRGVCKRPTLKSVKHLKSSYRELVSQYNSLLRLQMVKLITTMLIFKCGPICHG